MVVEPEVEMKVVKHAQVNDEKVEMMIRKSDLESEVKRTQLCAIFFALLREAENAENIRPKLRLCELN